MKLKRWILITAIAMAYLKVDTSWGLSPAFPPLPPGHIFSSYEPVRIKLKAPLTKLFEAQSLNFMEAKKVKVTGEISVEQNGNSSLTLTLPVEIRLKGFSSLGVCRFPKLELAFLSKQASGPFSRVKSVDLNTHCSEKEDSTVSEYFRASYFNHREALAYRMLDVLEIPSLRARPAWVEYMDTDSASPVAFQKNFAYQAFLLEDLSAFEDRLNVKQIKGVDDALKGIDVLQNPKKLKQYQFNDMQSSAVKADAEDASRIALFQYMVRNGDWFIKVKPDHQRTPGDKNNLWNMKMVETASGKWILMAQDFSLSGLLIGPAQTDFNRTVFESAPPASREKIKQLFRLKKAELLKLPGTLKSDPDGVAFITKQLQDFFNELDQL